MAKQPHDANPSRLVPQERMELINDVLSDPLLYSEEFLYWLAKFIKVRRSSRGGHIIEDEGVVLPQRTYLDFVGTPVTATDDAANDTTIVTLECCGSGFSTYRNCVLSNANLVYYWPGDEASGDLTDIVGGQVMTAHSFGGYPTYGNPGPFTDTTSVHLQGASGPVPSDSPWFTTPGGALSSVVGTTNHYSMECWIYPTAYASVSQSSILYCVPFGASTGVGVALSPAGILSSFRSWGTGFLTVTGVSTVALNAWTHWRVTFDGSVLKLYLNGILDATSAVDTHAVGTMGTYLTWGNHSESTTFFWTPFNGNMSDLAIYNTDVNTFCPTITPTGPGSGSADAGTVSTADGLGGTSWEFPTVKVSGTRYDELLAGNLMTATDNADGTVTLAATGVFDGGTP